VPVTGVSLLLRALILGEYDVAWRYFLPVLVPTIVYGGIALRWAIRITGGTRRSSGSQEFASDATSARTFRNDSMRTLTVSHSWRRRSMSSMGSESLP